MGLEYRLHCSDGSGAVSGREVAEAMGADPGSVIKTLVARGGSGRHYAFLVPSSGRLDLRKAACSVGEDSVDLVPSEDLLRITGYVHGGCSPVGSRTPLTTVMDSSAAGRGTLIIGGGRVGLQIEIRADVLEKAVGMTVADLLL